MKTLSRDTTPEAQAVQLALWKSMSPNRKLDITAAAIQAGFAIKIPELAVMDPFEIATKVVQVFDRHGIDYFLGGSIASTIHGEPRFTQDIDIVVRLTDEHVAMLQSELRDEFYLSATALREAIGRRGCANLIHNDTGFKIDLMVSRERAFEKSRFARKVSFRRGEQEFQVASPEDIILVKLEWYRAGGEVSDRQLRDVHTVLLTQESLDADYLTRWATELGVEDLLSAARENADRWHGDPPG